MEKIEHIGIAVRDITKANEIFKSILGKSISNQAIICEDKDGAVDIDALINSNNESGAFEFLNHEGDSLSQTYVT